MLKRLAEKWNKLWVALMWGNATEHDYRHLGWGHNITAVTRNRWCGWGYGLKSGDIVRLSDTKRVRLVNVRYFRDPPDMWSADVYGVVE